MKAEKAQILILEWPLLIQDANVIHTSMKLDTVEKRQSGGA
jgi:hypothetical protein